jgi:3',5'-cyclic AMP phosphodiesterase CpdA
MQRREAVRHVLTAAALPFIASCGLDRLTGSRPAFQVADGDSFTLIGACDPHCDKSNFSRRKATASMIKEVLDSNPNSLAFCGGDLTHRGSAEELAVWYEPSWGQFKDRTIWTLGDHDRWPDSNIGQTYYEYTGAARFSAHDLGQFYRLYNLNCESVDKGGVDHAEQLAWLEADLAQNTGKHIIALTHKPLYTCDDGLNQAFPYRVRPMWKVLQRYGCEFFLAGHAHRFESWKRKRADGSLSSNGIRQFVVGTGGVTLRSIVEKHADCEAVVVTHGVLRLDLNRDNYAWTFTDITGVVRHSGMQACRRVLA